MRSSILLLLFPLFLIASTLLTGPVTHISDGDTIRVGPVRIRLYGIDAPEMDQPFGDSSKLFVEKFLEGVDEVRVAVMGSDRWGRLIGEVYVSGRDVSLNRELVTAGLAWWYEDYARSDSDLKERHKRASAERLGLWIDSTAIAPWEWRSSR